MRWQYEDQAASPKYFAETRRPKERKALLCLFLLESWTSDASCLKCAGLLVEYRGPRSKPEIALAEIDRAMAAGVGFDCVQPDGGDATSARCFERALPDAGWPWAVGILCYLMVYSIDVQLILSGKEARSGGAGERSPIDW